MNVKYLRDSLRMINYVSIRVKYGFIDAKLLRKGTNYEKIIQPALRPRFIKAWGGASFNFVRFKSENEMKNDIESHVVKLKCWNCGLTFEKLELTCPKCESIIDNDLLKKYNYFELLDEKAKFDFDKQSLVKRLRNIQTKLHPDKTIQKSERDRQHSEELSSLMNKAFDTLSDRMLRGLYMLELANNPLEEGTSEMDPGFLAEVMEINEILAEADEGDLRIISVKNNKKLEYLYQKVSTAFERNDVAEAKRLLSQIKFFRNINDKIKKLGYDLE